MPYSSFLHTTPNPFGSNTGYEPMMAIETHADIKDDSQTLDSYKVVKWVCGALLVLCTLYLCYNLVRCLRLRAGKHAWPSLAILPLWHSKSQAELHCLLPSASSLQEVTVQQIDSNDIPQHGGQRVAFLELPPEIRTQIYSYLISASQPTSVSRAFRQTCNQIDHEVEHEARKTFTRSMISLQQLALNSQQLVTIFYSAQSYHVEMVLQLPQPYFPPNLPPAMPQARTVIDAVVLSFVELLPLTTRSMTLTIQPHPQGSITSYERYFDGAWSTLYDYLDRIKCDAMAGKTDLRELEVVSGAPVVLVPEVHFCGFTRRLNWINILGVSFGYSESFERLPGVKIDARSRCRKLFAQVLKLLGRRVKMYIRYKS